MMKEGRKGSNGEKEKGKARKGFTREEIGETKLTRRQEKM